MNTTFDYCFKTVWILAKLLLAVSAAVAVGNGNWQKATALILFVIFAELSDIRGLIVDAGKRGINLTITTKKK